MDEHLGSKESRANGDRSRRLQASHVHTPESMIEHKG